MWLMGVPLRFQSRIRCKYIYAQRKSNNISMRAEQGVYRHGYYTTAARDLSIRVCIARSIVLAACFDTAASV